MNEIGKYKYLVLYIKNERKIFDTITVSIKTFEELLGQRVLRFWELDEETGVKRDEN